MVCSGEAACNNCTCKALVQYINPSHCSLGLCLSCGHYFEGVNMSQGLVYVALLSLVILVYNKAESQTITIDGADPLTVKLGATVSLRCAASGLPVGMSNTELIWIFNGQNYESASNNGPTLERYHAIQSFGIGDIGTYTCRANHPSWSNPITDTVTIRVSPDGVVTVTPADRAPVSEGGSGTLTCSVPTGLPATQTRWFSPGNSLVCNENLTVSEVQSFAESNSSVGSASSFTVSSADSTKEGCYICLVTNAAGGGIDFTEVYVIPTFTEEPESPANGTVIGGNVTLSCDATSSPTPTFHWEKKDASGNFVVIPGETDKQLVLNSITLDDLTEYRCVATRGDSGRAESKVASIFVSPAGLISFDPSVLIAEYNSTVSFTCKTGSGSNDAHTFAWFYNVSSSVCDGDCVGTDENLNAFLSDIGSFINLTSVGTGPVLTLSNVDTSVSGTYYCAVLNDAGGDVAAANLYITPRITVHPLSKELDTIGSPAGTLTCMAESFPDPDYRWEKRIDTNEDYTEISNSQGSTYDLGGTHAQNTFGYYRCIAYTNVSGIINETASDPAIVSVVPVGQVSPSTTNAVGGDSVKFTCTATGGPANTYEWINNADNSVITASGRIEIATDSTMSALNITDIIGADHGTDRYSCKVTNAAGSDTKNVSLLVSPVGFTSISPVNNVTLNRGDDITLWCNTTAGPDNLHHWFHKATEQVCCPNGEDVNVTEVLQDNSGILVGTESSLELLSVNASHGGTYECIILNGAGAEVVSTGVFVNPYFAEQLPVKITAVTGENVTIVCNAEAYPSSLTYQWQKYNGASFVTLSGQVNRNLELISVTVEDLGQYRCVVQSEEHDPPPITSNVATVFVSPQDLVTIQPSVLIAEHNSEFSMTCGTTAGPSNSFVWFYNVSGIVCGDDCIGTTENFNTFLSDIDNFTNLTIVGSGPVLTLSNVDTSVSGTYYCAVINEAGSGVATANLYVTPNIITQPASVAVPTGPNGPTLTCMADSFPDPEYRWEKRSTPEDEYSEVPDSEGSSLTIKSVTHSTNGYYRCIAYTNVSGIINETASDPATVTVHPSGSIDISPTENNVNGGDTVNISCNSLSGPVNTFAWLFKGSEINEGGRYAITGDNKNSKLTIRDIIGGDHGIYTCRVVNLAGSDSATSLVTVSPEGFSSISPVNNVTLNRGDDTTLQCTTTAGPGIQYKWFQRATERVCCSNGEDVNITEVLLENANINVGTESSLVLSSVNASHGGSYECILINKPGFEALSTNVFILPYFAEQPPAIVVTDFGGNATIICNAGSYPPPTFKWQKFDGTNFVTLSGQENSSLELTSVTADDLGQYRCVVLTEELDPEPIISNISTLYVSPEGLVTIQPSVLIAEHNSEVTMTCGTTAGPSNSFVWLYNVSGIVCGDDCIGTTENFNAFLSDINSTSNLTVVGSGPVLTLSNVDTSVAGMYYCAVLNEAGAGIETVNLYITPKITSHPVGINATNGGSSHTMTCMADSFPDPEYRWERSNHLGDEYSVIPDSEGSSYDTGTISFPTNGYYRCIAYTNVSGIINETASNPAVITVRPNQGSLVPSSGINANGGDSATFNCSTPGGPVNTYTWTSSSGDAISDGGRYSITMITGDDEKSVLTISDIVGRDYGDITCQVTNFAGSGTYQSKLRVSPEGFSSISPVNNVTLNRGDDITLQCNTTAGPDNKHNWFHKATEQVCCPNGENVNITDVLQENANINVGTESSLDLSSVNASHGGTYECIITNDAGFEALSTNVFVRPYFVEQPAANVYTETGQNVTLDCNAESFPPPTFQWQKKNNNGNFVALSGETGRYLVYISITAGAFGEYRCVVRTQELGSTITSDVSVIHVSPMDIVSTTPQNVTVDTGDSVTLNCNTDAGPNNTIVWLRNGTAICENCDTSINFTTIDIDSYAIGRSSVLTLTNITAPRDGTHYQCVVLNEAGRGIDTSIVFVRPYFILHPQSVEIAVNTEWSLTCDAEGFPFPSIKWQKMNRATKNFEDYMNAKGTTLTFSSIVHDDFGMYRCVAINVINEEENMANSNPALITVSPEGSMAIDPQNETFNYSESARLNCSANGGPNNIFTWYLNDTVIESDSNNITIASTSFTSMLNISSVYAPRHGGTYTCMASNAAGSANISTDAFVSLRFLIRPAPVQLLVTNGDSHTFTCEAESYPVPMYTWRKGDVTIGPTDYWYPFNPVVFGDEGEYKCVATSNSQSIESSFTINVSPLTSARSDPNVTNSFVNMSVTFNCLALGGPNNHYFWKYNRTDMTLSDTNILSIVSHASHGGTYECIVGNLAGYDNTIATLNVGPEVLIHPSPQNVTIFVESIVLYCLVSGYPFPQIVWYLNDTQLFPESDGRINIATVDSPDLIPGYDSSGEFSGSGLSDFNLGSGMDSLEIRNPFNVSLGIGDIRDPFGTVSSRLVIRNTTISDSGMYHCEAVIDDLYDDNPSDSVLVLVQDVPDEPLDVCSRKNSSRYILLFWIIPHHNNAPILGYYVFYTCPHFLQFRCTSVTVSSTTYYLNVTDLHPGVTYNFTVLAFNEEGNSSLSLAYTVRTLEEAPGGPPTVVRGFAASHTQITVIWAQPEEINRHGIITSYDVMYTPLLDNCTEEDFKGIPANCTPKFVNGVTGENTTLNDLYIFVNYSIKVRARTAIGPGPWSSPIIILTDPHIPSPLLQPPPVPLVNIKITEALVSWMPPPDPNGIILSYTVTAVPLRLVESSLSSSRRRRQVESDPEIERCLLFLNGTEGNETDRLADGTVTSTVCGTVHQASLTSLLPYTIYEFVVQATTVVGTSNSSVPQQFSTREGVPSYVEGLVGSTLDSSTIIISWRSPPCPNDYLIGYYIYYTMDSNGDQRRKAFFNSSEYTRETLLDTSGQLSYRIRDLTPQNTYRIHVRAFSNSSVGSVDTEISVELKISITAPVIVTGDDGRPINVIDTSSSGISSLTFFLPTASALATASGFTEVMYYSVVVVPHPKSSFNITRDDFDTAYPNLQPYASRGSSSYYITAAWNDPNDVPKSFKVGDKVTRTASRNGTQETYFNAKLSRDTPYCVYIMMHGRWNMSNDTLVRVYEHACIETRLGYNLVALIVLLIFAVLVLCCLFWLLIFCCIYCRRKRRDQKQEYLFAAFNPDQEDTIRKKSLRESIRNSFRKKPPVAAENIIVLNNFAEKDFDSKAPVSILDFPTYVARMHQNADFLFSEEFAHVEPIQAPTRSASLNNKAKNRFLNIAAYDHSRVELQHCPSDSDYINANYIAGYDEKSGSYIATQGPLANTVNDFWCMIWEREVPVIVMLTSLVEKDKVKCHQYWPKSATEGENVLEYSSFRVTLLEEDVNEHFVIRKISLEMIGSNQRKIVSHYHFTSWPDHGAPSSSGPLLEFMERINQAYTPYDGPMTVHCSAGVGRTGTFIAIMVEMARIKSEKLVDIFNYVRYMRTRRPMMVMNEVEYIFIHDALVDALKLGKIEGVAVAGESAKSLEETTSEEGSDSSEKKKSADDVETEL